MRMPFAVSSRTTCGSRSFAWRPDVRAREHHLRRDVVVVEQPAEDVDLVDQRVVDRHRRHVLFGNRRVAVRRVHQQRPADLAVHDLLQHPVAGVVAPHEADLHKPAPERDLGVDDTLRAVGRGRQRLLAEAGLARGERGQHVLLVRRAPGCHQHRVDGVRRDQLLAGREGPGLGGDVGPDRRGAVRVDVRERRDRGAGEDPVDPARVVAPDRARADNSNANRHVSDLTSSTCRRSAASRSA